MFLSRVREHNAEQQLLRTGARVLVALSGGVDSVVLLHVLRRLGYGAEAAHVNFELRGDASRKDEAFVRDLCRSWGVRCHVERADHARRRGESVQMAARSLRYAMLARTAAREGLDVVALGHHRDDQVETVLLRLLRGTGPEGLAGMPVWRPLTPGAAVRLVRPLLAESKADIAAYAQREGLTWREDKSNTDPKYRRNALRIEVLPTLQRIFGQDISANIVRSASLMRDYVNDALLPSVEEKFALAAGKRRLDRRALGTMAPVWRRRVILEALRRWLPGAEWSRAAVESVDSLLGAQPGRRLEYRQGAVWRARDGLVFAPVAEKEAEEPVLVHAGDAVALPNGRLRVDVTDECPDRLDEGAPLSVFADALRLRFPLAVRRWRPGDRFRPLGMDGTKKVSDLLTDTKIRVEERRDTWVVRSGEDIVWVVGVRLSDQFKAVPSTRRFARLSFVRHA